MGSEGVKWLSDDLTGFRTPSVDAQIEENRLKAYEEGKIFTIEKENNPDKIDTGPTAPKKLDDGSVTILTGEEVVEMSGGLVKTLLPFAGITEILILAAIGLFRRRKKNGHSKV